MIWLIRHGESEANAGGITSDPAAIALTAQGHIQAEDVALAFHSVPDVIVTSRFFRSRQTAAPTIRRFPGACVAEWPIEEFTFLAPERCRAMSADDRRPLVDEYWDRSDPLHVDGPGAESFDAFIGRVRDFRDRLDSARGFVAVFSHGVFIRAAVSYLVADRPTHNGQAMRQFRRLLLQFPIPNGAILEACVDAKGQSVRGPITSHVVDH